MKNLVLFILIVFANQVCGQVVNEAKKDLEGLSVKFIAQKDIFDAEKIVLESLKEKIGIETNDESLNELDEQIKKTKRIGFSLDSICKVAENYKAFYLNKSEVKSQSFIESLNEYFPYKFELKTTDESLSTQKTLLYFGKDKVVDEQDGFFKDKKYNLIFNDVLEGFVFLITCKKKSDKLLGYPIFFKTIFIK